MIPVIRKAIGILHSRNFVFGDKGRAKLIDFDWCAVEGERYPIMLNVNDDIEWFPEIGGGVDYLLSDFRLLGWRDKPTLGIRWFSHLIVIVFITCNQQEVCLLQTRSHLGCRVEARTGRTVTVAPAKNETHFDLKCDAFIHFGQFETQFV